MRAALVLAVLAACKSPPPPAKTEAPGECLPLPGAARTNLLADPRGGGLYWFEPVTRYDYNGQLQRSWNLVRYDLAAHRLDTLLDHVSAPLHVIQDKLLVPHVVDKQTWLALVDPDGRVQSMLPDYLAPVDVELIDDRTVAVLADGDGPRAVYTIELDRPRPHHLIDADTLLSTWGGRVLIAADRAGTAIDLAGARKPLTLPDDSTHPEGQNAYYVANQNVHVHRMVSGDDRVIVGDRKPWVLEIQTGSVLARTPPDKDGSEAYLLSGGSAKKLPTVLGGASITAAAQLGPQTWALVGHNTANYRGDLGETAAETDVCLLPQTGTVTFPTRSAPKRFAAKLALFDAAVRAEIPKAGVQILDLADMPTEVYITLDEPGGNDLAAMARRARELHTRITSLLGDREVRTEIHYADERIAIQRWRRDRLRFRASVGIGDVLMSEPADYDLELHDLVNKRDGAKIVCSGKLGNPGAHAIEHVDIRCIAGDRVHVITIPSIAAHATESFSRAFDVDDDDAAPFFEVVSGREPLEILDVAAEAQLAKLFELATAVRDETQLVLEQHKTSPVPHVRVRAPEAFAKQTEDELTHAALAAYHQFQARMPAIFGLPASTHIAMTIAVEGGRTYDFDGEKLVATE